MGEFVNEGDARVAGDHGPHVHLGKLHPTVLDLRTGHNLESLEQSRSGRAAVGLHHRDHYVFAVGAEPGALFEHGVGFAHARGGAEQHSEPPAFHGR